MNIRISLIAVITGLALVGCGQKADDTKGASATANTSGEKKGLEYEMSGIPFDLNGTPVTLAGVTFVPASQWTDFGPSGMRKASYAYGPLEKDTDSATVYVFYFGENMGGTIDANLNRWINQMQMPDGRDPQTAKIQYTKEYGGMNVHIVSLQGNYLASAMGGPMSGESVTKENYRLVGAVIEAPQGNVFFKMTGPEYTARIMTEAFMTMLTQIKKAG